jgi:dienelactone hydrolase
VRRSLRLTAVAATLLAALAVVPGARATVEDDPCPDTTTWTAPAPAEWMGRATPTAVRFPARTGACLAGVLYSPDDSPDDGLDVRRPAVVIVPGTGGSGDSQWWAAHDLAGRGYAALIVAPQGQGDSDALGDPEPCHPTIDPTARVGQQCQGLPPATNIDNYADAISAAIDWLLSPASLTRVDPNRVGAAGFSQGARGATLSQMTDDRVRAVVAWDNLTSDTAGDDGAPSGGGVQGALIAGQDPTRSYPITPRVPAMGMASDGGQGDADVKKTAYEHWRAAGVPSMEVVFADTAHGDFSQRGTATPEEAAHLLPKAQFTRGWFDLWLRGDPTALEEAVGPGWSAARAVLDDAFHSAAYLPNVPLDCGDLSTCAAPVAFADALPAPPVERRPPTEMDLVEGWVASFQGYDVPAGPRTGTAGGAAAHRWFADRLADAGLRPRTQRFDVPVFKVRKASLTVDGVRPAVFPLHYSGVTPKAGITAPLVDVGAGTAADFATADVAGKIALIHSPMGPARPLTLESAMTGAIAGGALALVAALDGPGNLIPPPNTHYQAAPGPLPVLLLGWEDGESLRDRTGATATFVLDAEVVTRATDNVYAVVPGTGPGVVVIGTPLNGWFNTASERGSGIAVLLEVARRTAAGAAPAQTVIFAGFGGHEIEGGGLARFFECFDDGAVTAYLHLGATVAGRTFVETPDGVVALDVNEPRRAIYVSENPLLLGFVAQSFGPQFTGQAIRPSPGGVGNPGEQADAYALRIPNAAISGNSLYFHTTGDTPDTTSQALLRPMSNAYDQLLQSLLATDPATVRAANAVADGRAAPPADPYPCPSEVRR